MSTDVANSEQELRSQLSGLDVGSVDWVAETGSTNADLAARARRGETRAVLLAEGQTSGRGRRDRRWETPAGSNILLSVLLPTSLDASALGAVSVALAVATASACEEVGVDDVGLKWPNDVVRPEGKVGGLLAEVQPRDEGWVVVAGLGLNVGWPAAGEGPPGAARIGPVDRPALAASIIRRFLGLVDEAERVGTEPLRAEFEQRCVTVGQRVSIHHDVEGGDGSIVEGSAVGIDHAFRILVDAADGAGPVAFDVGDVVHLRPVD